MTAGVFGGTTPAAGAVVDSSGFSRCPTKTRTRGLTIADVICNNIYMAARRKNYNTMTKALRNAIAESEMSFKALERETGVLRQSLMKFAAGEQTIRLDSADTLAEYFGIQITRRKAN